MISCLNDFTEFVTHFHTNVSVLQRSKCKIIGNFHKSLKILKNYKTNLQFQKQGHFIVFRQSYLIAMMYSRYKFCAQNDAQKDRQKAKAFHCGIFPIF